MLLTTMLTMLYCFCPPILLILQACLGNPCMTSLDMLSQLQNKLVRIIYNIMMLILKLFTKKIKIVKFRN